MTQLFERNPLRHQDWPADCRTPNLLHRTLPSPLPAEPEASAGLSQRQVVENQRRRAMAIARTRNPVSLICQSMARLDEWDVSPFVFKHLQTGLELCVDPGWLTVGFSENSVVRIPLSLWDRMRLISSVKRLASAKVAVALVGDSRVCAISALRDSLDLHSNEWEVYPEVVVNQRSGIELVTSEGMLFLRFGMYSRQRFPISLVGRVRLWNAIRKLIREQVSLQFQGLM